jgi:non-specific serine/threonine protein kinase
MTGQTISHYRILEKLGEGGMGVVYKAEDSKLRRAVALKFLPPTEDAATRERFLREARAAAALNHPNICTIYEVDEEHGFIAMECVEGVELKARIAERPLPLNDALDIAIRSAQGLEAAHQKGVTHRDIKPANIMIDSQGRVKIMDFGLAQVDDASRLTQTGWAAGTPAYMSPEQAMGEREVDGRSDVYSLAIVGYQMLAAAISTRWAWSCTKCSPGGSRRSTIPNRSPRCVAAFLKRSTASSARRSRKIRPSATSMLRIWQGTCERLRLPPDRNEQIAGTC